MNKPKAAYTCDDPRLAWVDSLPPLLRREAMPEITGLGMRTIDRDIAEGAIPTVKIGRSRLILRDGFKAYLAAGLEG
jgi:excisionase family DNA binding protein